MFLLGLLSGFALGVIISAILMARRSTVKYPTWFEAVNGLPATGARETIGITRKTDHEDKFAVRFREAFDTPRSGIYPRSR